MMCINNEDMINNDKYDTECHSYYRQRPFHKEQHSFYTPTKLNNTI